MSIDRQLSTILHEQIPYPPRQLTSADIGAYLQNHPMPTGVPSRRVLSIAGAIGVMLVIAVAAALTFSARHGATPADRSVPFPQNVVWTLRSINGQTQLPGAGTLADLHANLYARGDTVYGVDGGCEGYALFGRIDNHAHTFVLSSSQPGISGCAPSAPGIPAVMAALRPFGSGIVAWRIGGDILTVSKRGAGQMTFIESGVPPRTLHLSSSLTPARAALRLDAGGVVMTYDRARGDLWLITLGARTPGASLVDYKPGVGVRATTALPRPYWSAVNDRVQVTPDGAIWITGGYAIGRYDPRTRQLQTMTLALHVQGATSNPNDPGTWVSAIVPEANNDVLLARNNVPYLTEISPTLVAGRHVPVEPSFTGYRSTVDLVLTDRGLLALTRNGTLSAPSRLAAAYLSAKDAPPGAADQMTGNNVPGVFGPVMYIKTAASGAKITVNELTAVGTITWLSAEGARATIAYLPSEQVPIGGALGTTSVQSVPMFPTIWSAVLDAHDNLWFTADWHGTSTLYELAPPK